MSFFQEGYEIPSSGQGGQYTKLEQGKNIIRILSTPLMGWEYWTADNKPVRSASKFENVPGDARLDDKGTFKQKHFWAMKVYNYQTEQAEIMQITQKGIQNAIVEFSQSPDYGDPREYDITITRKGEGIETEYTVMPSPQKPLKPEVVEADINTPVNLQALLTGKNPFEATIDEEVL